jgi:hypothetical protein
MKKTLAMIALCMGLNGLNQANASGGLESLTNDTRAIKSYTSGKITVPYNMGANYIGKVALLGNLARALADSPYSVQEESKNKFLFYSSGGESRFEIIQDTNTSNTFRKVVGVTGSRSFGRFKACMVLNCQSNSAGQIDYNSEMYTRLGSSFWNALVRNLASIPLIGHPVRRFFEKEQDGVVIMINNVAERVFDNPHEALESMENYGFVREDIFYVKKSLIENGFLEDE